MFAPTLFRLLLGALPHRALRRCGAWCAAAATCLAGAPAAAQKLLTIAVAATPMSLPLYVADSQGYFEQEGLKLRWIECSAGVRCLQHMLAGEADLATASDVGLMFSSFESSDFAVLGTFVSAHNNVKLVARRSAGIQSARQLAGKRIGVVPRSTSQYFLDAYLLLNGVDPRSVTVVHLDAEGLVDAVVAGRVDAISVWEPLSRQAASQLKSDATLLSDPGLYHQTFNLVASRRAIASREAELVKVLRALQRAQGFIHARPAEAQAILQARHKMDQASIDWFWQSVQYRLALDQALLRTLEAEARWAMRAGHVVARKAPNYLHFIHAAPLSSVDADAVSLPR